MGASRRRFGKNSAAALAWAASAPVVAQPVVRCARNERIRVRSRQWSDWLPFHDDLSYEVRGMSRILRFACTRGLHRGETPGEKASYGLLTVGADLPERRYGINECASGFIAEMNLTTWQRSSTVSHGVDLIKPFNRRAVHRGLQIEPFRGLIFWVRGAPLPFQFDFLQSEEGAPAGCRVREYDKDMDADRDRAKGVGYVRNPYDI